MAASRAKNLLLIFLWLLALKCALKPNKFSCLNGKPTRWIQVTQITQIGIFRRDWNHKCIQTRTRVGFATSRISYYNSGTATFNYQHVRLSGDRSPNPGPKSTRICTDCSRVVAQNHRATWCDSCSSWTHIKCSGVQSKEYRNMKSTGNFSRTCRSCLILL